MERFEYAVFLESSDEGGFVVTCRDLPELITQGESIADALNEARDALDEVIAAYMQGKREFPKPSNPREGEYLVGPPAETAAKAALYKTMREVKITNVELSRLLNIDEKEVRRMLDPHYGSKLPRLEEAIKVLGKKLVVGLA